MSNDKVWLFGLDARVWLKRKAMGKSVDRGVGTEGRKEVRERGRNSCEWGALT